MRASSSFVLLDDNRTLTLANTPVGWRGDYRGIGVLAQHSPQWQQLHVLLSSLARHPSRTLDVDAAAVCVVAAYCPRTARDPAGGASMRQQQRSWRRRCGEGRAIAVIDGADPDLLGGTSKREGSQCDALWDACPRADRDDVVRVSGNLPRLADVANGLRRGTCRALAVPYVSHARWPLPLVESPPTPRPLRVAAAFAVWGHNGAEAHGFNAWRRALRNGCTAAANCSRVWVSMGGKAEAALRLYATATFCLQPPGDAYPRGAIVDAMAMGCIPVFFHPSQRALWPLHWRAADVATSSVLLDWSAGLRAGPAALGVEGAPRPLLRDKAFRAAARTGAGGRGSGGGGCGGGGGGGGYAGLASAAMRALNAMPEAEVRRLQRGVARAVPRLLYRGENNRTASDPARARASLPPRLDAVDVLVRRLVRLSQRPDAAERRWLARFAERRAADALAEARLLKIVGRDGMPRKNASRLC